MHDSPSLPPSTLGLSKRVWRLLVILAAAAMLIGHSYFNPPQPKPDLAQRERVPTINLDRDSAQPKSAPRDDDSAATPAETSDDDLANSPLESRDISREKPAASSFVFRDMTIRDQDGRVVFRGDVDVRPELKRIDAGERLSFSHDGTIFQNREGRLAKKPSGHYREFVHPTPKLRGPGPQRIVTGKTGEAFYTPDHYQTFRRIR